MFYRGKETFTPSLAIPAKYTAGISRIKPAFGFSKSASRSLKKGVGHFLLSRPFPILRFYKVINFFPHSA